MLFVTVANIIASPFYGFLAERVEILLRGKSLDIQDDGLVGIVKDIPRIISREMRKLGFYLPRLILCFIISVIPVVNIIAPICWLLLGAWMYSIQYLDYAYDNHKISFAAMRKDLWQHRLGTFTFGAIVSVLMMLPFFNIFLPPIAVCAGTKFYVEASKRYNLDPHFTGGTNFQNGFNQNAAQGQAQPPYNQQQGQSGTQVNPYAASGSETQIYPQSHAQNSSDVINMGYNSAAQSNRQNRSR